MDGLTRRATRRKKGFSLLEMMLVLGIAAMAMTGVIQWMAKEGERAKAQELGEQTAYLGKALGDYISRESGVLSSCISAGTHLTGIPLSVLMNSVGTTTVGSCTLNNRQIIPTTFSATNVFGTGWLLGIENSPSGTLGGLVETSAPIIDPSSVGLVRYDWLGMAMAKAGTQAGITFNSSSVMTGLGGGWALTSADYPTISQAGLLGYRTGYQNNYDDVYARLDGAYPMKGDLNMGNYNIDNATDINYNGWLNGNNALLNNLKTGYISNSGDIATNSLTAATNVSTGTATINTVENVGATCSGNILGGTPTATDIALNGTIAQDGTGLLLSCQNGLWMYQIPPIMITIDANTNNYNLYYAAGSPSKPVRVFVTINAGVVIGSTNTTSYAFDTGVFAAGSQISIINNGVIVGEGGSGGRSVYSSAPCTTNGTDLWCYANGENGGPALHVQSTIKLANNGTIAGGGGGGGSGYTGDCGYWQLAGEGGGGGAGAMGGAGGPGGGNNTGYPFTVYGSSGGSGTISSGGAGNCAWGGSCSGNGGYLGANGGSGTAGCRGSSYPGGSAGAAIVGNGYVSWANTGTVIGSVY